MQRDHTGPLSTPNADGQAGSPRATSLEHVRVLDCGDESSAFATRILADLGADVVLVEPPDGSRVRHLAPFVDDVAGVERGYQHLYLNANKRSVVLDIERDVDRRRLIELAATADVFFETASPGYMASLELDYEHLSATNPGLVYVSVTAFGQTGPWSGRSTSDLVATAAGGLLAISGERDDPPMQGPATPAYKLASLAATAGVMLALHGRDGSAEGRGAHIDISLQEAVALSVIQSANANFYTQQNVFPERPGLSGATRCADGKWAGLNMRPQGMAGFIELLDEAGIDHGLPPDDLPVGPRGLNPLDGPLYDLAKELATHYTRDEFVRKMEAAGQLSMPALDLPDMAREAHYVETGQFIDVDNDLLGRTTSFPLSPVDCVTGGAPIRRAPGLGEHSAEILDAPDLSSPTRTPDRRASARARPLDGVRVVDFTWVLAGPLGTRILANFGAEVITVESEARMSPLRNAPLADGTRDVNLAGLFNAVNTNKLSLTLDLRDERSRELVRQLISTADLVIDNYSNGALARMGFDYGAMREVNPGLVMLHMPGCGADGPWSDRRTLGNLLMAASGLNSLMGLPDRPLRGLGTAYPDFTAPYQQAISAIAALRERDRTGKGREIHLSQLSGTVSLIGAEWMRFAHTGAQPIRPGNRDPNYAPHGVYRTRGEDEWCAISVRPEQWSALCEVIGRPELLSDVRFVSHDSRKLHEDALDGIITEWTCDADRWDLATALQAAGIAAAAVEKLPDMLDSDPQLEPYYRRVTQPVAPDHEIVVDAEPIRFAGVEFPLQRAPMLGEHNGYVLRDLLGMPRERFDELVAASVIA